MHDVLRNALAIYGQGVCVPKALCVAFSGGLDSTVLLDVAHKVCKEDAISLSAFHVNHGISKHAQKWQKHCEQECGRRNIPFVTQSLSLTKSPQQSLEANARDARYRLLNDYAKDTILVLLAQHEDDQAETVLLQLKRGAGLQGLSAMPMYIKKPANAAYLRPFLQQPRQSLLDYAQQHKLAWVEDESNHDTQYDRNFLRKQIMPHLVLRWPAINKTIARSALYCAQAQQVNNEYMDLLVQTLCDAQNALLIDVFLQHSPATQSSFIRHWLSTLYGVTPSSEQLKQIIKLTLPSKNASAYIQFGGITIEHFQHKLQVFKTIENTQASKMIELDWQTTSEIPLDSSWVLQKLSQTPNTDIISEQSASTMQVFSLPKEGVTCVFGGSNLPFRHQLNRPTKKMKVWYQEWKVSPLQRQQTPVFLHAERVIVAGLLPLKISCDNKQNEITVALLKKQR